MRRVLMVIVLASLVAAGCSGDGGATTTTAAETDASPTTTTTSAAPTTTRPPAPPPTGTAAPFSGDVDLLVADGDGVRVEHADGSVSDFVAGTPVALAFPDQEGGVVLQENAADPEWTWDDAAGAATPSPDAGDPTPIVRIAEPGAEPEIIVDDGEGRVVLERVTSVDGEALVVYRREFPAPDASCEAGDDVCLRQAVTRQLVVQQLDGGEPTVVGELPDPNWTWVSFIFGDVWTVALTTPHGGSYACGGLWSTRDMLTAAAATTWLGEGGPFWRRCDFGWGAASSEPDLTIRADVIADEDAPLAYVESLPDYPITLVTGDPAADEEMERTEIDVARFTPDWLDWDGERAITGDATRSETLLISPDGSAEELPSGWVLFWVGD